VNCQFGLGPSRPSRGSTCSQMPKPNCAKLHANNVIRSFAEKAPAAEPGLIEPLTFVPQTVLHELWAKVGDGMKG
jgi:hypothetical protein